MPEGEGGEARGRLSCSRVISLWWLKDPMVLSHSRSESWGVEEFVVESSQHILVVQRTARLAGSIRREAAYEAPVFCEELNSRGRDGRVGRGSSEQLLAAGSNRGRLMPSRSDAGRAARACAKCDKRRKTTGA